MGDSSVAWCGLYMYISFFFFLLCGEAYSEVLSIVWKIQYVVYQVEPGLTNWQTPVRVRSLTSFDPDPWTCDKMN